MRWQVSNGEKETKSSESIPKQTSALAEIEVIAKSLLIFVLKVYQAGNTLSYFFLYQGEAVTSCI